jgi:hypothetical protein
MPSLTQQCSEATAISLTDQLPLTLRMSIKLLQFPLQPTSIFPPPIPCLAHLLGTVLVCEVTGCSPVRSLQGSSHFMTSFSIQKSLKLWPSTLTQTHIHTHQIIWYGYSSEQTYYLHLQTAPQNRSSIFLWNTATQTTCKPNLDHIMFLHHCENLK